MQFPGFSSPASSGSGAPNALSSLLGAFLWLQTVQHIFVPYGPARCVSIGVLIIYLIITFPLTSTAARRIFAACLIISCGLLAVGSDPGQLYNGFDFALTFMAFLPSISMVRMLFKVVPSLVSLGDDIREISPDNRKRATLVLSNALGAIMSIGAFAAIAPLFNRVENPLERRQAGLTMMRGAALAMLWTPFTVGMGFASSNFPDVPLWKIMAVGFCISAFTIIFSLRNANRRDMSSVFGILRKLFLPITGSTATLVIANLVTGMSSLKLIILLVPPLSILFVFLASKDRRAAFASVGHSLWSDLGLMGNEMLLFVGSITMGALLSTNPHFLGLLNHLGLSEMPPYLIFPVFALGLIACAVIGLHASIIGPLVVAVYSGLNGQLSPFAAIILLLFGWSNASMLSVSSLGVAIITRSFSVNLRDVVWGENLLFALKLGAFLSASYAVLNLFGIQ
ncbi:hypothetical protein [Agrobacterium sp. T29]|uniref:hypothetical protein n=1 Tax=Agrobacterium sp. T29 TaxID=2580515 RepID=UPI00115DF034|nr:hypothetical protein [Agrobacterium sp. T29]